MSGIPTFQPIRVYPNGLYSVALWRRDSLGVYLEAHYIIGCAQSGEEGGKEAVLRAKEKHKYDSKKSDEQIKALLVSARSLSDPDLFGCFIVMGEEKPSQK